MNRVKVRAYDILSDLDRMPDNPDEAWLKGVCEKAERSGKLKLNVFVCPKFNTAALANGELLDYMPVNAQGVDDLFLQRQKKILLLLETLRDAGVEPELAVHIGDNDAEEYIFPHLPDEYFDFPAAANVARQKAYEQSLLRRVQSAFSGFKVSVVSLGRLGVTSSSRQPKSDSKAINQEVEFFGWLFGPKGPYKGRLLFSESVLKEMAVKKFQLYGAQGKYLQKEGGVLLQTEGPGVWLLRTQMLRCTGAKSIPAVYPWIRSEELQPSH